LTYFLQLFIHILQNDYATMEMNFVIFPFRGIQLVYLMTNLQKIHICLRILQGMGDASLAEIR
jgi:hypothetical protein